MGTLKGRMKQHEQKWPDLPWQKVRDSVEMKLYEHEEELYVLARSDGRQAKENAMRRSLPARDQLLWRIGAAKKEAGRAFGFVEIAFPLTLQAVIRETIRFWMNRGKLRQAEQRDGHYLLRTNLTGEDPAVFPPLKSEIGIRPVYHGLEHRADAHKMVAYCLQVTLKNRLEIHAPRLAPMAAMEKLGTIQMIDVWITTLDGRFLILPRYMQRPKDPQVLLEKIQLALRARPAPRIASTPAYVQSA